MDNGGVMTINTPLAGTQDHVAAGRIGVAIIQPVTGLVKAPAGTVCIGAALVTDGIGRSYTLDNCRIFIMTGGAPFIFTRLQSYAV